MSPDESQCLGCVYIVPSAKAGYDTEVYLWVRKSAYEQGMDSRLYKLIKDWIGKEWPFEKVAYPGREISWEDWE
jgi:hypothetical protein